MCKSIPHQNRAHLSSSLVLVPFSAVGCSKVSLAVPFICGQRIADLGSDGQYCRGIWSLHWRVHPSVCWLDTATSSDTSTSPPAPTGGSAIPESLTNTPGDTGRHCISILKQFSWWIRTWFMKPCLMDVLLAPCFAWKSTWNVIRNAFYLHNMMQFWRKQDIQWDENVRWNLVRN